MEREMMSTPEQSKKRVSLGDVSVLGKKVCLAELDLSKLIGGRAFKIPEQTDLSSSTLG